MKGEPPGLLHTGRVAHVRHQTFRHRFVYRLWMLSLDLDRLDAMGLATFRHNGAALVSLHDRDHGPRDGGRLRPWAEAQLAGAGLGRFAADLRLMVIPRVLGYAFNPLAMIFCRDEAGRLGAVLHQVKNTFGGQHAYVLPVEDAGRGVLRQTAGKRLHVSPFFDMSGGYRFAFNAPVFAPGETFTFSIRYGEPQAPRLTASMRLIAAPLTDRALLGQLLRMPLMTLKIFSAIHWEALRLRLRGAAFHSLPPAHTGLERS